MKEKLFYGAFGSGSSSLGMITGFLTFHNMIDALLLGFMGALGGLAVKQLIPLVKWLFSRKKNRAK